LTSFGLSAMSTPKDATPTCLAKFSCGASAA
jgi:hypothetical protein